MNFTTSFARAARLDLLEIARYIARDNPPRAISYSQELVDFCIKISKTPFSAPVMKERKNQGYRKENTAIILSFIASKKTRLKYFALCTALGIT
jgi:plasmid stabilization system protein ParE